MFLALCLGCDRGHGMADRDRYDEVTRLLQVHLLQAHLPRRRRRAAHCWHVVKPLPCDIDGYVVIQNTAGKNVVVPISHKDVNDLSDEDLLKRIRTAISKA
jgi:hypothetical protein